VDVSVDQELPRVIIVRVGARLSPAAWQAAQLEVAKHLSSQHQSSLLVDATALEGFESGDWEDLSFQLKHDADISRMAVVVRPQWEDRALMFTGQGLRSVEIRCFPPEKHVEARRWAAETVGSEGTVKR
jgi:hypothetical protein